MRVTHDEAAYFPNAQSARTDEKYPGGSSDARSEQNSFDVLTGGIRSRRIRPEKSQLVCDVTGTMGNQNIIV